MASPGVVLLAPEPSSEPDMDPVELHYHRLNTEAFIGVKPTSIVLIPQLQERTPSGGWKFTEQDPRDAQVFRIIELGGNQTPPILTLTDGKQRAAEFWLLGKFDALMDVNDWWEAADPSTGRVRQWLVGDIVRSNGYEVRGLVTERGK